MLKDAEPANASTSETMRAGMQEKATRVTDGLPRTIWWEVDEATGRAGVYLIDQTRLPLQGDILCCNTHEGVCTAIATLALRGAPALGLGGAFALAVWSENESQEETLDAYLAALDEVAAHVSAVRPTAVNLSWGCSQVTSFAHEQVAQGCTLAKLKAGIVELACRLRDDDEECCRAIGEMGYPLFERFAACTSESEQADVNDSSGDERLCGARVLTHCNAGSLATARLGTAISVITTAFERGGVAQVWACETRPVNQGARLTSWEFMVCGIPCVLICDDMVASVMAAGWVDAVVVGADRICANGDVANKIGTYGLACLARAHNIPFYVAAPTSSIDPACATGADIPVEQRDPREVEGFTASGIILPSSPNEARAFDLLTEQGTHALTLKHGHEMTISRKGGGYAFDAWMRTTPPGVVVYNPAFDVTPASLIDCIITEKGLFAPERIMDCMK